MNLKVIYEDNHIIVVVKPVGIPVQADKTGDKDMLTIIKEYLKEKYNKPGNVYLGLVHRLDRMVGGVMVFAKTSKAASRLSEYIRQKNVKKSRKTFNIPVTIVFSQAETCKTQISRILNKTRGNGHKRNRKMG